MWHAYLIHTYCLYIYCYIYTTYIYTAYTHTHTLQGPNGPASYERYRILLQRVKAQLARIRQLEHLLDTYAADGWRGARSVGL